MDAAEGLRWSRKPTRGRYYPALTRAFAVWRSWRRADRQVFQVRWRHHWRLGDGALFVHIGCASAIVGCEAAFWPGWLGDALAAAFQPVWSFSPNVLSSSLAVLATGNSAWTLRIILRHRSLAARPRPLALLAAALGGALPLLGLLLIPLWRRLEERRPGWLVVAAEERPRTRLVTTAAERTELPGLLARALSGARFQVRRLEATSVPILWLGPGNLAWVLPASAWLIATAPRPVVPLPVLGAAAVCLHLLGFAAARAAEPEPQVLTPSSHRRRLLDWLWLLPSPLPQVRFLTLLGRGPRRDQALVYQALLGRGFRGSPSGALLTARAHAAWRSRPDRWRSLRPAGPDSEPGLDAASRRFLAVARWKTAGLTLDGFTLAAVAGASGGLPHSSTVPVPAWVWFFLASTLLIIGLALLLWGAQQAARLLDAGGFLASLGRLPYLRTVAFGQLALTLGFYGGMVLIAIGDWRLSVLSLTYGWVLAVLLIVFGTFFNPTRIGGRGRRDPGDRWFWLGFFSAAPIFLFTLAWAAGPSGDHTTAIAALAVAASLTWGAAVAGAGSSALCHPLEPHRIADPAIPPALRTALRFILVTAALPLGGLLTPAWLALRQRYRAPMEEVAANVLGGAACTP